MDDKLGNEFEIGHIIAYGGLCRYISIDLYQIIGFTKCQIKCIELTWNRVFPRETPDRYEPSKHEIKIVQPADALIIRGYSVDEIMRYQDPNPQPQPSNFRCDVCEDKGGWCCWTPRAGD